MKYIVTTHEEEIIRYYYEVEANSKEEAEEKVRSGDTGTAPSRKFISGEIVNVEVEEVPDEP